MKQKNNKTEELDIWDERLNKIKKYGVILTLLINVGMGVGSLGMNIPFSLFLFASAFILLDYLWKFHRKPKELQHEKKKWWEK